jgi:hypothetical protein
MTQFKEGFVANRETGMSLDLRRRFVIVRWQENDWDEPCKSRDLRTVLWAAGGEIPPADPAIGSELSVRRVTNLFRRRTAANLQPRGEAWK